MPVPNEITDLFPDAVSNYPVGSETPSSMDNYLRAHAAFIRQNFDSIQAGNLVWCGTSTGTSNAITLTPSPAITAYSAGQVFRFKAGNSNTLATTVAISGLSTIALQVNGAACVGGEVVAGQFYELLLDTTSTAQLKACFSPLLKDNLFRLVGSSDATKRLALEVDGLTTATTRTLTVQDKDLTIAGIDDIQSLAPLPPKYIDGLIASNNATDANNDIDIPAGDCRDSTNAFNMSLSATLTKRLDAAWAAGTNQGGLFSGTKANSTWYHVFLIRKDSDGTIDAGFDTSLSAANKPSGYSNYRHIGSVLTDDSSNIIAFKAMEISGGGLRVDYMSVRQDVSLTSSLTTTRQLLTISTPLGIEVEAHLGYFTQRGSSSMNVDIYYPGKTAQTAGQSTTVTSGIASANSAAGGKATIRTNTSSQVAAVSDNAVGVNLNLTTYGYTWGRR